MANLSTFRFRGIYLKNRLFLLFSITLVCLLSFFFFQMTNPSPGYAGERVFSDQQMMINGEKTPVFLEIRVDKHGQLFLPWPQIAEFLGRSRLHQIYSHDPEKLLSREQLEEFLGVEITWNIHAEILEITGPKTNRLTEFVIDDHRESLELRMDFNFPVSHTLTVLPSPPRIVIEIDDLLLDAHQLNRSLPLRGAATERVRFTQQVEGARIVVDLGYRGPEVEIHAREDGYRLELVVERIFENRVSVVVERGIIYEQIRRGLFDGPLILNLLRIDPQLSDVELEPVLAGDRLGSRLNLQEIVFNRGGVVAGVNGGFFAGDGTPLGLLIIDQQWVSEPIMSRTAVGITSEQDLLFSRVDFEGRVVFSGVGESDIPEQIQIDGINRSRGQDELILYNYYSGEMTDTNRYGVELAVAGGQVTANREGPGTIPSEGYVLSGHGENAAQLARIPVGTEVELDLKLPPEWEEAGVLHALGAGPRLVAEGEISVLGAEEGFADSFVENRHPRAALGVTPIGELLLVSVAGRNEQSVGMTLLELAKFLQEEGAVEAINLDGGGSTSLFLRERIMNLPGDGRHRAIPNVLVLRRRRD